MKLYIVTVNEPVFLNKYIKGVIKRIKPVEIAIVEHNPKFSFKNLKNFLAIYSYKSICYTIFKLFKLKPDYKNVVYIKNPNDQEFIERIRKLKPDVVLYQAPIFLKKEILDSSTFINRHASLLPKYKGSFPVLRQIKNRDYLFGVTIHKMAEDIDKGEIIVQKSIRIKSNNAYKIYSKLFELSVEPTIEAIERIAKRNKVVFLDRDGVLNEDPGYVHKVREFKLIKGAIEGLKLLKNFKLLIVTSQSGIGRGYFREQDLHKFNDHLLKELLKHKIKIEKVYYCPHHPKDNCRCRKPETKLVEDAQKEFNINLKESFVIGDHERDIEMGRRKGCKTIYVLTGHGKRYFSDVKVKPDFIANDLIEAARFINQNKEKIKTKKEIEKVVEELKQKGKKIVTCNGCFDILHPGHIYFLKEAKKQGDILIVGLNSDTSVRLNKGPKRPINNQEARADVLSSLKMVDYVVIFNEKTPIKLLERIKPDVHCNGEEYGYRCIEAPSIKKYGGKIHLIKDFGGFSTTKIIKGKNML